jgi:methyl-accepting chemotaxis protein
VIANISRVLAEIGNAHAANLPRAEERATLFTTGTSLMESAIGLADKSKQNTGQIKTHLAKIGDIAAKINLIAINASIEAAHAGNSGRGFRVIATEIRTLSELTNRLTSDIKGVTNEIARDTDTAVEEVGEARSAYHDILSNVSSMTSDLYNAAGSIKTVTDDVKTNYRTIGELLIGLKEKIESLKANSDYCHQALDEIKKIGEKAGEQIDCLEFDATDASSINLSVLEESENYEKTLSEVESQISKYKVRYERLGQ